MIFPQIFYSVVRIHPHHLFLYRCVYAASIAVFIAVFIAIGDA